MDFHIKWALGVMLLLLCSCRSGSENLRGKNQLGPGVKEPDKDSGDATGEPTTDPNQAPVIIDSSNPQPLKLAAEVDQTGLPAGFIDDIFAMHKIDANKSILFGKSKESWLLDESKDGLLTRLTSDITPPTGSSLFVMENKNFWLLNKSTVAFPSTVPPKDQGQITLINLAPDLLKDPANVVRVLYAGPERLIIATEQRANIILLEGDKARVIALDFPKMGDVPLPIRAAGLIQSSDSFWFLSSDRLLLLKKSGQGQWKWVISKFKVESALPPDGATQVAMVVDAKDDKSFSFVGRTFEFAAGKLYEQNPIKLSVDKAEATTDPAFANEIQPLLKDFCSPCHAGYEQYPTVKAKAAAFKQMIGDGTMPKNMALTAEQIKTLTDYMTKLMTP